MKQAPTDHLPFQKYTASAVNVDALEITPDFVTSLPRMGGNPVSAGSEQIELMHKNRKKSFGNLGDFLVKSESGELVIYPGQVFRGMYSRSPEVQDPALVEAETASSPESTSLEEVKTEEVKTEVVITEELAQELDALDAPLEGEAVEESYPEVRDTPLDKHSKKKNK